MQAKTNTHFDAIIVFFYDEFTESINPEIVIEKVDRHTRLGYSQVHMNFVHISERPTTRGFIHNNASFTSIEGTNDSGIQIQLMKILF